MCDIYREAYFSQKVFPTQLSVKKVMLTVFRDMKGPITIDFLEKGATLNCFLLLAPEAKYTLSIE